MKKEIIRKLNNLRELPLDEAVKRVATKLYEIPYLRIRKGILKYKPIDMKDIYFHNYKPSSSFFFDSINKEKMVNKLKEINVDKQIINNADKINDHVFNLLGSGDRYVGKNLPWNQDFKTGYVWENQFYKDIKIIDLTNNADVKVPWELSRFQHLFTLGKAYWLTGNEKYVIEFKNEIEDWISKNPIEMSVNWTCTMDVAIRAVNWIIAFFLFKDSKMLDENFWTKFHKSLFLHGKFIFLNLENTGKHTGNHYLSNIVGLIWLGIYFSNFQIKDQNKKNSPAKWLDFGVEELEKEMFIQNNADGTNYEASTSYHRLVTELILITTILANKNGIHFSDAYNERLEKMCEFLQDITKNNGLTPTVGDADDGRLWIISDYGHWEKRDYRHLLSIAGEYFDRPDFKTIGNSYWEDVIWIFNDSRKTLNTSLKPILSSKAYPNGGYYVLRNKNLYTLIRCGEMSFRGDGGHSHNDQLSFELSVFGIDFIVDPGAYVYTSEFQQRNLFRMTSMHNTVEIENFEQNEIEELNLFQLKEQTFAESTYFDENKFSGFHKGFEKKCGITHKRHFSLKDNTIEIDDLFEGNQNTIKKINFILDPEVDILSESANEICLTKENKILKLTFNEEVHLKVNECYYSRSYGVKELSKKIEVVTTNNSHKTKIFVYEEN